MHFTVLQISPYDPDIEMLKKLEKDGLEVFVSVCDKIRDGTEDDLYFFKNYLNNYLFEGLNFTSKVWNEFMKLLSVNKKTLDLVDFIEVDVRKQTVASNIIKLYTHPDIDKIILDPKILPYWNMKDVEILPRLLESRHLNIGRFLRCPETREDTKLWIKEYYNENKRLKSLVSVNIIDIYHLDKKFEDIIYLTMQLLKLFMKKVTYEKVHTFKLPATSGKEEVDITFLNECFYILHNYIDLSVLNLISIKKNIKYALEEMEELYNSHADRDTSAVYKLKIDFFKSLLNKLENIEFDKKLCMEFYKEITIEWISKLDEEECSSNEIIDEILSSTIEYLNYDNPIIHFNPTLFDVFMKILNNSNPLTASKYIKTRCVGILSMNFGVFESCAKINILNNLDNFVKYITHLYINIANIDDYDSIAYQQEILTLLAPYKQVVVDLFEREYIDKFVHCLLENYDYFYRGFFTNIKLIYDKKNDEEVGEEERTKFINQKKIGLKWYQNELFTMNDFLVNVNILKSTTHIGIRDKFASILGSNMETLVGKERAKLNIHEDNEYFNPRKHLKNMYDMFYLLRCNVDFKKCLVAETRYLKTEYILKMTDILLKKNMILRSEADDLVELCTFIDNERAKEEEDDDNIPEELLDPIMGTLIENPVVLPNSDTVMEKDVIIRHLMNNEENPFTREALTVKELEEYNEKEEVQSFIVGFKLRLAERR